MAEFDIAVIGGDKRTACMVPFFQDKGLRVICYKIQSAGEKEIHADCYAASLQEAVGNADTIVGGIPPEKAGVLSLGELSPLLKRRHAVFAGVIPEAFCLECNERGIACHDFMRDEKLAVFNAVATAEGAILEALKNQDTNIHRSRSLVLGYGRCGKVLSEKLKGLSAAVTVCSSDRVELAQAEAYGMSTVPLGLLEEQIEEFEYIYNTIPVLLLGEKLLRKVHRNALVIDIASGQGGVDYKAAKALQIHALHCLGLPGKYAGRASAGRLADYVMDWR